jgi:S-formylglutathione hydrolase FrmB
MKYASRVQGISAHSAITKVSQLSQFIPFPAEEFQFAGDVDTDLRHWAKENHDTLPPIRFDCGTEDSLIEPNRALHRALTELRVRHVYEEFPGGHDWQYWTQQVRRTLAFCKSVLAK